MLNVYVIKLWGDLVAAESRIDAAIFYRKKYPASAAVPADFTQKKNLFYTGKRARII